MPALPTLDLLTPLSRPAAGRALERAARINPEAELRLDQLSSLQHSFRLGAEPNPHRYANPDSWSTLDSRPPSHTLTVALLEEAKREKLLVAASCDEGDYPPSSTYPNMARYPVRLHPQHQIDLLLKLKLVREWEKDGGPVMRHRGPLLSELLQQHADYAVGVDAGEAFYTVIRSAAPTSKRGVEARRLAAGLGVAAQEQVIDAGPLLEMMARLSPFNGSADELFETASAVLA